MVDFDRIESFLNNLFVNDGKANEILAKYEVTPAQLKIINLLIINALKAYDSETRGK